MYSAPTMDVLAMNDTFGIGFFVLNVISCVFVGWLASRWGRNFWLYFLGSMLLTPIYGLIRLWIHDRAEHH